MHFYGKDVIDEIKASQRDFIKSSPTYSSFDFASNMQKKFANRKSVGRNPFPSGSPQTLYPDPLYTGNLRHFKTFADYNNRDDCEGGALLYDSMPKGGEMSESSEDEYSSGDDEDEEGAGIYDDYIVPFGKTLGKVGKEVFSDVVIPVGKELLKKAVMAKLGGDHECGGLGASKAEYVKMLGKINGRYGVKEEHLKKLKAKELKKMLMHNDPEALERLAEIMNARQRKARKDKGMKRQKYEKVDFGVGPEDIAMEDGGLVGTKPEFKKILGEMFADHKLPSKLDKLNKEQLKSMILADADEMDSMASQFGKKARKPRAKKAKAPKDKKPRATRGKKSIEELKELIASPHIDDPQQKKKRSAMDAVRSLISSSGPKATRAKKLPEGVESVVEVPSRKKKSVGKKSIEEEVRSLISSPHVSDPQQKKKRSAMDAIKGLISSPVAKAPRAKRSPSKRNDIVKRVMAEQGLSMIQASKYVKENGLY